MISKKSSVNPFGFTFRKTFLKSFWIPLAMLLFNSYMVLTNIVAFIIRYNEYLKDDPETAAKIIKDTVFELSLTGTTGLAQILWGALIIIASVATAASVFRFMMNKSAVNVWYSLGMTRSKLFWSKYLAGALSLTISSVLPIIISTILNIYLFGSCNELWLAAFYLAISFWSLTLIAYTIAACTFCGVGTMLEGIFFSLVYCVMPGIAELFIEACYSNFLYGAPTSSESWSNMGQVFVLGNGYHTFRSPGLGILDFTFFPASANHARMAALNVNETFSVNFTLPLTAVALLIMAAFVALWVHNRRKAEIAGFLGTNALATGVVVFTSATLVNTFLMKYVVDVNAKNQFICALIAVLVFAVIYIIADAISLRSIKLIIKKLWKFPLHLGIFFGIILFFTTGLFGYSSRIPDLANIKSVSISTNTADMFVNYKNINQNGSDYLSEFETIDEFLSVGNSTCSLAGNFTDRMDIENIVSIHKQLIECKNLDAIPENASAPYDERVVPSNIAVIYSLKDGRTFERVYYAATEDILCQLANLTLTEHYKSVASDSLKNGFNEPSYVGDLLYYDLSLTVISPNMSNITAVPNIDTDDIFLLSDAVAKDVENGSLPLNLRSESDILGYIKISPYNEYTVSYSPDVSSDILGFTETVIVEEAITENEESTYSEPYNLNNKSDGVRAADRGVVIPVFSNMKNTVETAESIGLMQYFEDTSKPVEAKIWKLDEYAKTDYIWRYRTMTSLTSGYWSNGKTCSENEAARGEIIEDEKYLDLYNRLPELPESAKTVTDPTEIEKLQKEARMVALTCYDGEYIQFIFEDGSMTFGYIPA